MSLKNIQADNADIRIYQADNSAEDQIITPLPGCSDPAACNYQPAATEDDGSCTYVSDSCLTLSPEDPGYDSVIQGGGCNMIPFTKCPGCHQSSESAFVDYQGGQGNEWCEYCDDPEASNYDAAKDGQDNYLAKRSMCLYSVCKTPARESSGVKVCNKYVDFETFEGLTANNYLHSEDKCVYAVEGCNCNGTDTMLAPGYCGDCNTEVVYTVEGLAEGICDCNSDVINTDVYCDCTGTLKTPNCDCESTTPLDPTFCDCYAQNIQGPCGCDGDVASGTLPDRLDILIDPNIVKNSDGTPYTTGVYSSSTICDCNVFSGSITTPFYKDFNGDGKGQSNNDFVVFVCPNELPGGVFNPEVGISSTVNPVAGGYTLELSACEDIEKDCNGICPSEREDVYGSAMGAALNNCGQCTPPSFQNYAGWEDDCCSYELDSACSICQTSYNNGVVGALKYIGDSGDPENPFRIAYIDRDGNVGYFSTCNCSNLEGVNYYSYKLEDAGVFKQNACGGCTQDGYKTSPEYITFEGTLNKIGGTPGVAIYAPETEVSTDPTTGERSFLNRTSYSYYCGCSDYANNNPISLSSDQCCPGTVKGCDGNCHDPLNLPNVDCSGTCNGTAVEDECGVCGGSGIPEGNCDCFGNSEGCDGICGSSQTLDQCGDCGGNGTQCVGCMDPEAENYMPTATISCLECCEYLDWRSIIEDVDVEESYDSLNTLPPAPGNKRGYIVPRPEQAVMFALSGTNLMDLEGHGPLITPEQLKVLMQGADSGVLTGYGVTLGEDFEVAIKKIFPDGLASRLDKVKEIYTNQGWGEEYIKAKQLQYISVTFTIFYNYFANPLSQAILLKNDHLSPFALEGFGRGGTLDTGRLSNSMINGVYNYKKVISGTDSSEGISYETKHMQFKYNYLYAKAFGVVDFFNSFIVNSENQTSGVVIYTAHFSNEITDSYDPDKLDFIGDGTVSGSSYGSFTQYTWADFLSWRIEYNLERSISPNYSIMIEENDNDAVGSGDILFDYGSGVYDEIGTPKLNFRDVNKNAPTADQRSRPDESRIRREELPISDAEYAAFWDELGENILNKVPVTYQFNVNRSKNSGSVAPFEIKFSQLIPGVLGCTDENACNYNGMAFAHDPDNPCTYPEPGYFCDGSTIPVYGCTDPQGVNYNEAANTPDPDNPCIYTGCTDPDAINYSSYASIDDGSCIIPIACGGLSLNKICCKEGYQNSSTAFTTSITDDTLNPIEYNAYNECEECDNSVCAEFPADTDEGPVSPTVTYVCCDENAINTHSSEWIDGVTVCSPLKCLYGNTDEASIFYADVTVFLENSEITQKDLESLKFVVYDTNSNIVGESRVLSLNNAKPKQKNRKGRAGFLAYSVEGVMPFQSTNACVYFLPIGYKENRIWDYVEVDIVYTNTIVHSMYGKETPFVKQGLYTPNTFNDNYSTTNDGTAVLNLSNEVCTQGCDKSLDVLRTEKCTLDIKKDDIEFTELYITITSSQVDAPFESSYLEVYNIDNGDVFAEYRGLKAGNTYTLKAALLKDTSIGIKAHNASGAALSYQVMTEYGKIITTKTIR